MKFEIKKYRGAGKFRLGVTREKNRKTVPVVPMEYIRGTDSGISGDLYEELGVELEYNEENLCDAIEMSYPANPIYKNIELLQIPYYFLLVLLRWEDPNLEEDELGFISYNLGIGIYAPNKTESPTMNAESVIVFKDGLFD
jgi:hypothetical protein